MPSAYVTLQKAILVAISQPQFSAALPPLSDDTWARLLSPSSSTREENERLEFFGDALMHATIGRQLYEQIPDGSPGLYTALRAALHSNATFSHLAEKLDILAVSSSVLRALTMRTFGEGASAPCKSKCQIKATADLFETLIAAYYMDHGFESLCDWVRELYTPLIAAAKAAYHEWKVADKQRRPKSSIHISSGADRGMKGLPTSSLSRDVKPRIYHEPMPYAPTSGTHVMPRISNTISHPASHTSSPAVKSGSSGSSGRMVSTTSPLQPTVIDLTAEPDPSDDERWGSTKATYFSPLVALRPRRHSSSGILSSSCRPHSPDYIVIDDDTDGSTTSADEYMLEQMLLREDMDMDSDNLEDMDLGSDS